MCIVETYRNTGKLTLSFNFYHFILLKHVTDIILRKRREMADTECQITPLIDSLVLIDRNVDLLTPLLTQLTYEGLIDEHLIIENSEFERMSIYCCCETISLLF